ncbi:pyridoxamine 5'-phosphate oxidase family protein [Candidatus Saccharibacteria bacterium]|nr:pyridoxamine 5'-phosphate oxidase family protein [Candidatus Saccharibacteria bacterium]
MENREIVEALSGVWYLATSEDEQPHVRPLDKVAEIDGEIYFGTSKTKKMFAQILQNPKIEVYAMNEFGACRFMAETEPTEDANLTERAFEQMGKPMDGNSVAVKMTNIIKA